MGRLRIIQRERYKYRYEWNNGTQVYEIKTEANDDVPTRENEYEKSVERCENVEERVEGGGRVGCGEKKIEKDCNLRWIKRQKYCDEKIITTIGRYTYLHKNMYIYSIVGIVYYSIVVLSLEYLHCRIKTRSTITSKVLYRDKYVYYFESSFLFFNSSS